MKTIFLRHSGTRSLNLFFAGWGSDVNLLQPAAGGNDLLMCYDYRQIDDFDFSLLDDYREVCLVAWSLGVWVAQHCLSSRELPLVDAVAINGTLQPISGTCGIVPAIFHGTIASLGERTLMKFRRRMCGAGYDEFMSHAPVRTVGGLKAELESLRDAIEADSSISASIYHRAVIGKDDAIFLPACQQRAWAKEGVPSMEVAAPHYCKTLFYTL